ncbi:MAG: NUDIX domain-containing protein [Candidatus Dechloromonas phosphoritropha]
MSSASSLPIYPMPFVRIELAVLSIVDGKLSALLGKRTGMPHIGQWALPGGVLRIDLDNDLDDAAQRVAMERLGTRLPFLRQLTAVGSKERDPRAPWALSIAFRAMVPVEAIAPAAGKRIEALQWRSADEAATDESLAFDHAALIQTAVEATRREIDELQLPFGFLPEQFTLGELQSCCEALLGHRLDKSSFRRRLDDREVVEAIPGEMKTGAFRPAQLFRRRLDSSD